MANNIQDSKKDDKRVARVVPYSKYAPWEVRPDADRESQRSTAINIVANNGDSIRDVADRFNVSRTAIATAIIWEGAENYKWLMPGTPGRFNRNVAKNLFEKDKRIPRDYTPDRIGEPKVAIVYIAAMMDEHCRSYENIAGVNIRGNGAIQAQLYQQGNSQVSARKLKNAREADRQAGRPLTKPRVPMGINGMGEYNEKYLDFFTRMTSDPLIRQHSNNSPAQLASNTLTASSGAGDWEKLPSDIKQNIIIFTEWPGVKTVGEVSENNADKAKEEQLTTIQDIPQKVASGDGYGR
jgi:hypothetical protein